MVKVGLGVSSSGSPVAARRKARASAVLPAPSSPLSTMKSPGRAKPASQRASAAVAASSSQLDDFDRQIGVQATVHA